MKAWLQITSGRGPEECALAVAETMNAFAAEAKERHFAVDLLEAVGARHAGTYRSVLLTVEGEDVPLRTYLATWEGSVQWVIQSPYRPNHGRKNWFVGVNVFYPPEDSAAFCEKDIRYEAQRASGPGGQHVNKTSSAIRAIHVPTGTVAYAQEERSQFMNKKLATARLFAALNGRVQQAQNALEQEVWHCHDTLQRGNPVRVFKAKNQPRK